MHAHDHHHITTSPHPCCGVAATNCRRHAAGDHAVKFAGVGRVDVLVR